MLSIIFRSSTLATLFLFGGVSSTLFAAETQFPKAGEWTGDRRLTLTALPLPAKPHPVRECLTAEEGKKQPELLSAVNKQEIVKGCELSKRKVEGQVLTADLDCKPQQKAGRIEMTLGSDAVSSTVTLYNGASVNDGVFLVYTDAFNRIADKCN